MLGYTWYAKSACKTGVNTESKLLLLEYVFEQKKAIAVEFRTHYFQRGFKNFNRKTGSQAGRDFTQPSKNA